MRFNKPTRLDAGIFLVSFAVLLLELLLTRIFSVTLYYHLSFMVVSLAMLGFAAGGLAANLWSNRFRESALLGQLSVLSLFFCVDNRRRGIRRASSLRVFVPYAWQSH